VPLTVSYATASEFVTEYVENIAVGGLFVAGAGALDLLREIDVEIILSDTTWKVRAKPVYVIDGEMARTAGKPAGTGMEITVKPAGFDAAMHAHLIKLGKRREVAVMVGDVPGAARLGDAGFRLIPLESLEAFCGVLGDKLAHVIALVVPARLREAYVEVARSSGHLVAIYSSSRPNDVDDIVRQIDRLL